MKTLLQLIFLVAFGTFIYSCGPSEKERADAQKVHDDSIRTVMQNMETMKRDCDHLKLQKDSAEKHLVSLRGDLAAAQDKMSSIKEFQLMRSSSDREQQIKDQTMLIDNLQSDIIKTEQAIAIMEQDVAAMETKLASNN